MGLAKQNWIDSQERGWSAPDTFVCEECIDDNFLREIVRDKVAKTECSYCGRKEKKPIAAALEDILPYIAGAFFQHFEEPGAAGLPRDSGEWVAEDLITDTADALLSLGLSVDSELFEDICNSFNDYAWVPAAEGFWLGEHEHQRLRYSWEDFTQRTKHTSRYFFFHENHEDNEIRSGYSPGQILKKIGEIINHFSLWKELPKDTKLYRARKNQQDSDYKDFDDLCPPPHSKASAGRMNPAGISYGYFSLDDTTTILEVADTPPSSYAVGKFSTNLPLLAIDLTALPPVPSIFDIDIKFERNILIFLQSFIKAISIPVSKDGREHVDYVPSQIVSEFFAQILHLDIDKKIGAMMYPSAVDPGHTNIVVFPKRQIYSDNGWKKIFELSDVSEITLNDWKDFGGLTDRKFQIDWN